MRKRNCFGEQELIFFCALFIRNHRYLCTKVINIIQREYRLNSIIQNKLKSEEKNLANLTFLTNNIRYLILTMLNIS